MYLTTSCDNLSVVYPIFIIISMVLACTQGSHPSRPVEMAVQNDGVVGCSGSGGQEKEKMAVTATRARVGAKATAGVKASAGVKATAGVGGRGQTPTRGNGWIAIEKNRHGYIVLSSLGRRIVANGAARRRKVKDVRQRVIYAHEDANAVTAKPTIRKIADIDSLLAQPRSKLSIPSPNAALNAVQLLVADGLVNGFGNAINLPKRSISLADLRLHKIDGVKLLAPRDSLLISVRNSGLLAIWGSAFALVFLNQQELLVSYLVFVAFVTVLDAVLLSGALEFLAVDTLANLLYPSYRERVAVHEAGHFLVAYLLGILPKDYTLTALEAIKRGLKDEEESDGASIFALNKMQAGTVLCDEEFTEELKTGKISSASLDKFACISLAGISAEYLSNGKVLCM